MIIYSCTKKEFLDNVPMPKEKATALAEELKKAVHNKLKEDTSDSEFHSWENSLPYMRSVLEDKNIPDDAGITIEYNIPGTSVRIDFIVSGYDNDGNPNLIIFELKQWTEIEPVPGEDWVVKAYTGKRYRNVPHPCYQAYSYMCEIEDFCPIVEEKHIKITPCVYLHNYDKPDDEDPLFDSKYKDYLDNVTVFKKDDDEKIRELIEEHITTGDKGGTGKDDILKMIDAQPPATSKRLQDFIADIIQGEEKFKLLDDQRVVYDEILKIAKQANSNESDDEKQVIIVKGGPGTGKTVLAVNLLAQLCKDVGNCRYTSKNGAPRYVYTSYLRGINIPTKDKPMGISALNLFTWSTAFDLCTNNAYSVILADEAHRLMRRDKKKCNQVESIINAARCSVFFIDENQRVTLDDVGTVDSIYDAVDKIKKTGHEKIIVHDKLPELKSQFRCDGSNGYLEWLDNTLEIKDTGVKDLSGINYDFKVIDSPEKLYEEIEKKDQESENGARLVAGYCWPWRNKDNPNRPDVVIGDFKMSWNLQFPYDREKNDYSYILDPGSINQIGCIHTVQGLELDYVGVIIGEDLRYEDGKLKADCSKHPSEYPEGDFAINAKRLREKYPDPDEAKKVEDEIIKNTYKVLMTRGMKGCYIYCMDDNLANYFKKAVRGQQES